MKPDRNSLNSIASPLPFSPTRRHTVLPILMYNYHTLVRRTRRTLVHTSTDDVRGVMVYASHVLVWFFLAGSSLFNQLVKQ